MNKKQDNDFIKPLIYSLIIFIIVGISEKVGFSKYSTPAIDPVPWSVFINKGLPKAFIISLIFFLGLFLWQIIKRKK